MCHVNRNMDCCLSLYDLSFALIRCSQWPEHFTHGITQSIILFSQLQIRCLSHYHSSRRGVAGQYDQRRHDPSIATGCPMVVADHQLALLHAHWVGCHLS